MEQSQFEKLVQELVSFPKETEWIEFKHNQSNPQEIGEYVSALSNSVALYKKPSGFIIWGVEDKTHQLIGTTFKPSQAKKGNEELENWILTQLEPRIDFQIWEGIVGGREISVIEVQPARHYPVSFRGIEYIRVGSYKKKLQDYPEKEKALWRLFDKEPFEVGIALSSISSDKVLSIIDYPNFFHLLGYKLPENRSGILDRLAQENVIKESGKEYHITNLGAILFARNLKDCGRLKRKALRVITYKENNKISASRETEYFDGYAIGFEKMVREINEQLPRNEQIGEALRKEVRMYPEIAIRELVANALIHQDFDITGAGPMVEIFKDRVEIVNPGSPLIDTLRFIDSPPLSRNEELASLMRRMNICEERGSGIDKVISEIEFYQLPPPDFRKTEKSTTSILLAPKTFSEMDGVERVRACYQHACLQYLAGKSMTNNSLRKRLGLEDKQYTSASNIIKNATEAGLIKLQNADSGKRNSNYLPFWA